ncbi:MAG TPA: LytTR family DNA-binding domain-containing protein [Bacteroidales bacterium]|nr:LytTR family DNA-binding domain-containing protein [Bacteroidales bacterium]
MIRCIAIDKDEEALSELKSLIEKVPFLTLLDTFRNPLDANGLLARRSADLIFADPDMDVINGIDFIKSLNYSPMVVFITNNRDYAVDAYNAGVLDYIIKPLSIERLIRAVTRAYELLIPDDTRGHSNSTLVEGSRYLFMKVDNRMQRFSVDEILFIEGCNDYVRIYTAGQRPALASMNMKNIEKKLPHGHFCRVHRSYIVSLGRIDSIERKRIKIGEKIIPVSSSYYPVLLQAIDATAPAQG